MRKLLIISLLLTCSFVLTTSCSTKKEDDILILNQDNFDRETQSGVVLVDFWASWCMPCRAMAPVVHEIASQTKGKIKVGKVDVDANGELAQRFNVQGIPNFIILKDGKEVENMVGIQSKEALIQAIEKYTSLK